MTGQINDLRSETNIRIDSLHKELRIAVIAIVTLNLGGLSVATAVLATVLG